MFEFHSFVTIKENTINIPHQNAVIGELSSTSYTFSREHGYHADDAHPATHLTSFYSEDSTLGRVEPPAEIVDVSLDVAEWIANQSKQGGITANVNKLEQDLRTQFPGIYTDIEFGDIIEDRGDFCPEYIKFWGDEDADADNDKQITLWFVDSAFARLYPHYEIVVIGPCEDYNDLHKPVNLVSPILGEMSMDDFMTKARAITDGHPDTATRSMPFIWHQKDDNTVQLPSEWVVVIYGARGELISNIHEAMRQHILDNSDYIEWEWALVYPDLFNPTELIFMPNYNLIAMADNVKDPMLYSPAVPYAMITPEVKRFFPTQEDEDHILTNLSFVPFVFKSLTCNVVGGERNKDAQFKFSDLFPDYINVSSTSNDFARMSDKTKGMVWAVNSLLTAAETWDFNVALSPEHLLAQHDDKYYLVTMYEGMALTVLTQRSFEENYNAS